MDVGNGTDELNPTIGPVTTAFQHIAMTVDDDGNVVLFLNGSANTPEAWTGASAIAYEVLKIGANRDSGTVNGHVFDGLVDEVHVFDRALSLSEIKAIYDAGSSGLCP
jgi:Concanavalin A-like lectin/glucanases superfamily